MCIENSLGNITLMLGCKGLRLFLIVSVLMSVRYSIFNLFQQQFSEIHCLHFTL